MSEEQLMKQRIQQCLRSERFLSMDQFIQHGNTTTLEHSILVTYYSYRLNQFLHLHSDISALLTGALLHDYYLYDWHEKEAWHRWHGFRHPTFSLRQALIDYELTKKEIDIIKKHMWPLTIIPPRYREAWIVCSVDKVSSLMEFIIQYRMFKRLETLWKIRILQSFDI